jgi:hypothetical protein
MGIKAPVQPSAAAPVATSAPRATVQDRGFRESDRVEEQEHSPRLGVPFRFDEISLDPRSGPRPQSPIIARTQQAANNGEQTEHSRADGLKLAARIFQRNRPPGPQPLGPIPEATRMRMERSFGRRFDDVVVHPDSPRAEGPVHALTEGRHIHFAPGRFHPGTPHGDWLIGHELAHVVQQTQGGRAAPQAFALTARPDALEAEADRAATRAAQDRPAVVHLRAPQDAAQAFSEAASHDTAPDMTATESEAMEVPGESGATELGDGPALDSEQEPGDGPALDSEQEPEDGPALDSEQELADIAQSFDADALAAEAGGAEGAGGGGAGAGAGAGADAGGAGAGGTAASGGSSEAPEVGKLTPDGAFGQLHGLRPDKLAGALGGVRAAVAADVDQARATLVENPPASTSAAGSPGAAPPKSELANASHAVNAPGVAPQKSKPAAQSHTARAPGAAPQKDKPADQSYIVGAPGVVPQKSKPAGDSRAEHAFTVRTRDIQGSSPVIGKERAGKQEGAPAPMRPDVRGGMQADKPARNPQASPSPATRPSTPGAGTSKGDARDLAGTIKRIPTRPQQSAARAGASPTLAMSGEASAAAGKKRGELEKSVTLARNSARQDMARPVGENAIAPTVPPRRLTASFAARKDGADGKAAAMQAETVVQAGGLDEAGGAVGIIAQQTKGAEIAAAVAQAQTDIAAQRQAHADLEAQKRSEADQQIASLKEQAQVEQDQARESARAEVDRVRGQWEAEVDKQSEDARAKADSEVQSGHAQIESAQATANDEAQRHMRQGEEKATTEEKKGQQQAEKLKQDQEKESGFVEWVKSVAQAVLDKLKSAISAVIDLARKAAQHAIDAAKKLATAAIERARQVVTSTIQAVGKVLTAIGDRLLADFPALRERFRKTMQGLVAKAVDTVNQVAGKLQVGIQATLDLLGQGIEAGLGLLEKGLHAIVDGVGAVVKGAIDFAQSMAKSFGSFLALIQDVASDPGGWLGKLGAAVMDGIRNHLWQALQTAVMAWFQSKVLELLGIGGTIVELLQEGGISLESIGQMTWEALKSAIPAALISILIEKLVSMLVPAVGAVLAIIEALQAAWGTVSRIIAAFESFIAFLKAVKGGNAGPQFANLLAAVAVVVLDFVANWLLRKLRGAAGKVGAKLKGLAERFRNRRRGRPRKGGKQKPDKKEKTPTRAQMMAKLRDAESAIAPRITGKSARAARATVRRMAPRFHLGKRKVSGSLIRRGKHWALHLSINPEIEKIYRGDAGQIKEKAQQAKRTVGDLNDALKKKRQEIVAELKERGVSHREATRQAREQLRTSDVDQTIGALPERELREGERFATSRAKAQEAGAKKDGGWAVDTGHKVKGADSMVVIPGEKKTVEILEAKDRPSLTVFDPRSSTETKVKDGVETKVPRSLPEPGEAIDVGKKSDTGKSAAAAHFEKNPADLDAVLKKEKQVVGTGKDGKQRLLENKLSAITENLQVTIERAMDAQKAIYKSKEASAEQRRQALDAFKLLSAVLRGKESTLRIVINLPKDGTMSESERNLAVKMIERSFALMQENAKASEAKLELVLRNADAEDKDPQDQPLRPAT